MIIKSIQTTSTKCFFCEDIATARNTDGLEVCRHCVDKTQDINCPIHNTPMETKTGKYGAYFFCWDCQRNWSKKQIKTFR